MTTLPNVAIYCVDPHMQNIADDVRQVFQSFIDVPDVVHCPYRLNPDYYEISIKDEASRLRNLLQGTNGD